MSYDTISCESRALVWTRGNLTLRVEPWGASSVRVRATPAADFKDLPGALLPQPARANVDIRKLEDAVELRNGMLTVSVNEKGRLRFFNSESGRVLLEEPAIEILHPPAREFKQGPGNLWRLEARFLAKDNEKFFGMGQHRHGLFDQKGCVLDLRQENCEVNIPFTLSNRGYGFLWHNPALGRAEFGRTLTRWTAETTHQLDYWVTAGDTPAEIMSHYADATGHAPMLPEWASGFWQSKLRYKTQEELLDVAREYRRRELPLSVIVIDFFHWPRMGDFCFESESWPNPEEMLNELADMGVKAMVSIWPSFNMNSRNFEEFDQNGFIVQTDSGAPATNRFIDNQQEGHVYLHFYDPTNPDARQLFWNKIRETYYKQGFRVFWVDCCEPQLDRQVYENMRFHLGSAKEVGCLYPLLQAKTFHDGMTAAGEDELFLLCRSAWAGSQRYGTAVWSGDIKSTFEVLDGQVRAGLNMAVSGIPWWTTDIGGFHSGDPSKAYFRELIVRWFQYGIFCPLFRLHGVREPVIDHKQGGQPNEVWSFGEKAYEIIKDLMFLRERLRPYVMEGMREASENGTPLMRPLFFEFPDDNQCWELDDQFMFGSEILVAPVATEGATSRDVYLPAGANWTNAWTGAEHTGGMNITADAPLERIPVFLKGNDNPLAELFQSGKE